MPVKKGKVKLNSINRFLHSNLLGAKLQISLSLSLFPLYAKSSLFTLVGWLDGFFFSLRKIPPSKLKTNFKNCFSPFEFLFPASKQNWNIYFLLSFLYILLIIAQKREKKETLINTFR